ncbi:MAG: hypothetical protein J7483_10725 [Novosphingobium sp.]|nr:hypothetical protein [Novosphingobium sp.]
MTNLLKKATLGLALAATALTAAAVPAEAQRYRHGGRHHDNSGAVVVAGIAGLAIGAAIASNDRRYDYDRRYYRDHGYYPQDGYYYRNDYRRHRGYQYCETRRQWDPYYHRPVMVQYCR